MVVTGIVWHERPPTKLTMSFQQGVWIVHPSVDTDLNRIGKFMVRRLTKHSCSENRLANQAPSQWQSIQTTELAQSSHMSSSSKQGHGNIITHGSASSFERHIHAATCERRKSDKVQNRSNVEFMKRLQWLAIDSGASARAETNHETLHSKN